MEPVRFGIIGFGFMGHVHEEMLTNRLEGAIVTAICDVLPAQMEDAVTPGVKKFTDYRDLLACPDVDVVILPIPNHLHHQVVLAAAKAGKDIICEKPAAMSLADFDDMTEACRAAGVRFTVHQQRRFDPDFTGGKRVFESGDLGKVYTVQSMLYGYNGNMHDWHVLPDWGGGMLYDWGVHLIDQLLDMIPGKVKTVYADIRNVINRDVDDYFKLELYFDSGVLGEIELGTYFLTDKASWFEHHWFIGGDKASAYCDGFDPKWMEVTTRELLHSVPGKPTMTAAGPTRSFGTPPEGMLITTPQAPTQTSHLMYFENYLRARAGLEPFLVQSAQVRRVLALMDAARKSAQDHRTVDFE